MSRLDMGEREDRPLRPYQVKALSDLRGLFAAGHKRALMSLPTGGGKTRITLELAKLAKKRGNRLAVLCERVVLCRQWEQEAWKVGLDCGIVQAEKNRIGADLTAYSQQTIEARLGQRNAVIPDEEIVVVDECHIQRKAITEWLRNLPESRFVIGLTATPHPDGLGDTYGAMVQGPTTNELREDGWLLPERVFSAQTKIDMAGARVNPVNGEWVGGEIDERVAAVVGDVPKEWLRVCETLLNCEEIPHTIVFSATVASGKMLVDAWNNLGIGEVAGQISCYDTVEQREAAIKAFKSGEKPVIVNVSVIGRGFDAPQASVLVDASPYRASITSYAQMVGRVLRPSQGRATEGEHAFILDHGGNYARFFDQWIRFCRYGVDKLLPDKPDPEDRPASTWLEVWHCMNCGAINPLKSMECGADEFVKGCGAAREPGQGKNQGWRCGVCRRINSSGQYDCKKPGCDGKLPKSGPGGEDDERTAWECGGCNALNDMRVAECVNCGLERPKSWEEVEGELVEVKLEPAMGVKENAGIEDRKYVWAHLCELATRHYLKRGGAVTRAKLEKARKLAMARYRTMYGAWPGYPFRETREPLADPRIERWWTKKQSQYAAQFGGGYGRGGRAPEAQITGGYGFSA